ncbi:hypothetical protein G9A89_006524 [Geosiphon pyriformis]|nr:hypothetical protein G9A89_006524 [Geosiphon pyriformis]
METFSNFEETWEEIFDWDVEEDVEFAKRITITSIHPNLGKTFSTSSYDHLNEENNNEDDEEVENSYEYIETYQKATFSNILKSSRWGPMVIPTEQNLYKNKSTSRRNIKTKIYPIPTINNSYSSSSSSSSSSSEDEKYRINRRREQKEIAKLHDRRLYSQLLGDQEIQDAYFRGDKVQNGNENESYLYLKACRKAMKDRKKLKGK